MTNENKSPEKKASMVYFKGTVWGTKDVFVYGAHFYDEKRNYIITNIPGENLILFSHRSDNVELYAVNPGSVEMVPDKDLCPICGKPICEAEWHDIGKNNGESVPIKATVQLSTDGTYDISRLDEKYQPLYSFEPTKFCREDMIALNLFQENIGAHCIHCGATL